MKKNKYTGLYKVLRHNINYLPTYYYTTCNSNIHRPFRMYLYRCECNPNLACLKTDDDLSVNAYVYRCKNRPAATTTDVMPTTV